MLSLPVLLMASFITPFDFDALEINVVDVYDVYDGYDVYDILDVV